MRVKYIWSIDSGGDFEKKINDFIESLPIYSQVIDIKFQEYADGETDVVKTALILYEKIK